MILSRWKIPTAGTRSIVPTELIDAGFDAFSVNENNSALGWLAIYFSPSIYKFTNFSLNLYMKNFLPKKPGEQERFETV